MKRKFSTTVDQCRVGVQYGSETSATRGRATRHSRQRRQPAARRKGGNRKMGQSLDATASVKAAKTPIHRRETAVGLWLPRDALTAATKASSMKNTGIESLCPVPQNSINGSGDHA